VRYDDSTNDNISSINREGSNYMTITAENATTETVTLSTQDGTVVRLINGDYTLAPAGALAVVDRSRDTDQSRFLPISWLKGHVVNDMAQMDGGYDPETFEVCEFQVGDRVRVVGTIFENGFEGVIESIPAVNSDDCTVAVDTGSTATLTYGFDVLEKIEVEDDCCASYYEDDEPLAEWEKELLGYSTPDALQPGDIAVIVVEDSRKQGDEMDMSEWDGLRFVVESSNDWDYVLVNGSIDTRPDKYDSDFHWPKGQVRRFEAKDFRVGDLVESIQFGENGEPAKAVVTRLDGEFGGDIEVNWTEGLSTLVAYGPIGARRFHLTLTGVAPAAEPEFAVGDTVTVTGNTVSGHYLRVGTTATVEATKLIKDGDHAGKFEFQVIGQQDDDRTALTQFLLVDDLEGVSDFTFEAGQEIGSSDVLADLPMGTVLVVNEDVESPVVKLGSGSFGRLNRWNSGSHRTAPIAYFEDDMVAQAADGGGTLVIGYVPTV
jgi:hypothetical protein